MWWGEGQRETPAEREVPDPRAESRQPKPSARPSRSLDHVGLHSLKQVGVWGRARSGRGGDPRDPQTPPTPRGLGQGLLVTPAWSTSSLFPPRTVFPNALPAP